MINLALQKIDIAPNHVDNSVNTRSEFLGNFLNACRQFLGEETTAKWLAELTIFSHSTSEIIFAAP